MSLTGWVWPTDLITAISGYNYTGNHHAIDIGTPDGSNVLAPKGGEVIYVGNDNADNGGYGLYVVIKTTDGPRVYLAHLSEAFVALHQSVHTGTVIGKSGHSGNASGPHLHFEIRGAESGWLNPWDIYGNNPSPGTPYDWAGGPVTLPAAGAVGSGAAAVGSLLDEGLLGPLKFDLSNISWFNVVTVIVGIGLIGIGTWALIQRTVFGQQVKEQVGETLKTTAKMAVKVA